MKVTIDNGELLVVEFESGEEIFKISHDIKGGVFIEQTAGWLIKSEEDIEKDYKVIYERKEDEEGED